MKKLFFLPIFVLVLFVFAACGDDDSTTDTTPEYHVHINSPNTDDKHVGDSIHIHVNFEDHNGGTVHHVNVRIYNKATGEEIYNMPTDAHVHAESGSYDHHDDFQLNVTEHTDWVLIAKVWGHEDGVGEVSESIEFHVHP
ncbi:MAG: hypothetical protein R2825_13535 [Saprospiraceae bacterium]